MLNVRINRRPATGQGRAAATVVLLALTLLIGGFGARAQSFASLSGSVLDPNRQGVPRAALILTNVASQAKHEVRSDDRGRFEFVGLPPGAYQLEAQLTGFRQLRQEVQIAGRNVTRELTLSLGSLMETITIVATPGEPSVRSDVRQRVATARPEVKECQPAATGGNIRPPMKIRDVRPVYPTNPDGSIAGVVVLEGQIGKDGAISQVKTLRSPHPELERAAAEAFEQWEFTPTLLNCVPVDVTITATMTFSTRK